MHVVSIRVNREIGRDMKLGQGGRRERKRQRDRETETDRESGGRH